MSKKKKVISDEPIAVRDFKSWINGITEFQSPDWVPNVQQWKAIMDKIQQLEESRPPTTQTSVRDTISQGQFGAAATASPKPLEPHSYPQASTEVLPRPSSLLVNTPTTGKEDEEYKSPFV